jgi:two-component system, NtrC family, sensor kinase
MNELTALLASSQPLAQILQTFSSAVAKLIRFDGLGFSLVNYEQGEIELTEVTGHMLPPDPRLVRRPLAGTLAELVVQTARPLIIPDLADPSVPPVSRELFAATPCRAALMAPLAAAGAVLGTVTVASYRRDAFDSVDLEILTEAARPLASVIAHSRLLTESGRRAEESEDRARETRALFEAGRAVSRSLDFHQTIRVILEQARAVLSADSCGLMRVEPESRDLVLVASLDLPPTTWPQVRLREGEGLIGLAVGERRPVQTADLEADTLVRYRQLPREGGFHSMLAVPLTVGDRAIGVLTVLRRDVHHFSDREKNLLLAFADQAAMALEHAGLYARLERMVADRTQELNAEKRFVETVLETLPVGLFVVDESLRLVRGNSAGHRTLPRGGAVGDSFLQWIPPASADRIRTLLAGALVERRVKEAEEEMLHGGEATTLRLTAAPLEAEAERVSHVLLVVEDVTLAKRLSQQMLLTERLTTAGHLAAGVAHELNNPLATIAGCAEALRERGRAPELAVRPEFADFPQYLGLIEEEAYRCKQITSGLLQLVRDPGSQRVPTDLNALVRKVIELLPHQSRFAEAEFHTELDRELPKVIANDGQLRQVFFGIAANALEAMGGQGRLTVRSRVIRDAVEIEFEDEGPGIPDHVLARVFDPFFTTKPPGQGTGLGLTIAQGIVADHAGRIEVASQVGRGSIFRVVVPA